MTRFVVAVTVISACLAGLALIVVLAILSPARAHDIYLEWKDNKGFDCCHGKDCKPVKADPTPAGWSVWHDGRWVPVPPDAVLKIPSPDGRSHVCIAPGAVEPRCFVPGDTKS